MNLRHLITTVVWNLDRPVTVGEMIQILDSAGLEPPGRASKTISDALRWEVGKGRLVRIRRGIYGPGRMPRSTRWWIRRRVVEAVAPPLAI